MNGESITPLSAAGLRGLPGRIKHAVGRVFGRKDGSGEVINESPKSSTTDVSPELRERAASDIRAYAEDNETLFNRASRFEERVERLDEGDGETSESAQRRAERARAEIKSGFEELRSSFASSHGEEGRRAFDVELGDLYPRFAAPGEG